MWLIEPPTPAQEAPVYIAAKATAHKPRKKERILGICEGIEMGGGISIGDAPFIGAANSYMERYERKPNFFGDGSKTTVTVLQQPAHGRLKFTRVDEYNHGDETLDPAEAEFNAKGLVIRYIPETDYSGDDSYVVQFDQGGVKVKVKNFFMMDSRVDLKYGGCVTVPGQYKKDGDSWKISLLPSQTTDDLDSWLRATSLQEP